MPPINSHCPVCQAENPIGTRFCAQCGHPLTSNERGAAAPRQTILEGRSAFRLLGLGTGASALLLSLLVILLLGGGLWFLAKYRQPAQNGTWFRLHGSTTIGLTLAPRLADAFLRSKGATAVSTESVPGRTIHFRVQGTLPSQSSPRVIEIEALGSGPGFVDLAHGDCDIAMSSREIKQSEVDSLKPFGEFTERSSDRILGLDGVAVIVNRDNPLDEINLDDLASIFSGVDRQWDRLKGAGSGEIFVTARDEKSGTWETFRDLVLVPRHMTLMNLDISRRFDDNAKLAAAVSANPLAIGFVGMTYAKDVKILKVGYPGLRALLPTRLTVLHEEYPLRRRLHLFVPSRIAQSGGAKDPATLEAARGFSEFALSHEGQAVVDASGFVSEDTSTSMSQTGSDKLPPGYPSVMLGATRVYTLFFHSGSATLEPLALDNIDRLADLMTTPANKNASVFLVGHADKTGTHQANLDVSQQRVERVRQTLDDRGVPVALALPLGEEYPIEPNIPGKGNPRNRRVEVWMKRK